MNETEKRKQENPKVTETITFRTTAERKFRLTQKAVEKGIPLSSHCEDVIFNMEDSFEKGSAEMQKNQMKELYEMVEELLQRNSELQEQVKRLAEQPKPITEIKTELALGQVSEVVPVLVSEVVEGEKVKESLISIISQVVPEKEREKFVVRFKKMYEHRAKSGKDKSEEETIYRCIIYCIQWGAFFDAG